MTKIWLAQYGKKCSSILLNEITWTKKERNSLFKYLFKGLEPSVRIYPFWGWWVEIYQLPLATVRLWMKKLQGNLLHLSKKEKGMTLFTHLLSFKKNFFFLSKWDNKFWKNTCLVCVVCWEKKIIFLKYATIKFEYTKILRNEDKRKLKEKWEV